MTTTDNVSQEKKLINTLGGTLWKGYEDLMDTMKPWSSKSKKDDSLSMNQITPSLDKRENDLIKQSNPKRH
jgi:hypothetical protein